MQPFRYATAISPADALPHPTDGKAEAAHQMLAGGTDLLPLMKAGLAAPPALIDIKPLTSLRHITVANDGTIRIGALTTLAEIERSEVLAERVPVLVQAVRDAATPQLRARATIGGNLLQRNRCWYFRDGHPCWMNGGADCFARDGQNKYAAIFDQSPCVAVHPSDIAPALIALGAEVMTRSPRGEHPRQVSNLLAPPESDRRVEHRLAPDELITEIRIPAWPAAARGVYLKMMDRQAWSFALVSAAAQLVVRDGRVETARLVLGGVANVPWRVASAELLEGNELTPELAAQVADRAVQDATPLTHNAYKVPMVRALARRAILAAGGMEG